MLKQTTVHKHPSAKMQFNCDQTFSTLMIMRSNDEIQLVMEKLIRFCDDFSWKITKNLFFLHHLQIIGHYFAF